jgi:hypothetical protein
MRRFFYFLSQVVLFPVDLFRFTADAWRYTFSWMNYCLLNDSKDLPCLLCRGLDLGEVPRRVSFRVKYRSIWLAKLLHPELETMPAGDRVRPRIACMREGGYIRLKWYVPVLAVVLGFAWNAALFALLWVTHVIPEPVQERIIGILP